MDFVFGKTVAEKISKFPSSGELQKAGEGLLIQLLIEAEADVLGVDGDGMGMKQNDRL